MSEHTQGPWTPSFSRWRHGGWYVHNVRYENGACGCVHNGYADGRWRIADDSRPIKSVPTFSTRTDAANAERIWAERHALLAACEEYVACMDWHDEIMRHADTTGAAWREHADTYKARVATARQGLRAAVAAARGEE